MITDKCKLQNRLLHGYCPTVGPNDEPCTCDCHESNGSDAVPDAEPGRKATSEPLPESHRQCLHGHICQKPSGRACAEQPCDQPAGTWWGPYWCPEHDKQRLDRVTRGFASVMEGHRAAVEAARQASIDLMAKTCGHPASDLLVVDGLHYCQGCATDPEMSGMVNADPSGKDRAARAARLPHADVPGLTPETCPEREAHGNPFRMCPVKGCGWHEDYVAPDA